MIWRLAAVSCDRCPGALLNMWPVFASSISNLPPAAAMRAKAMTEQWAEMSQAPTALLNQSELSCSACACSAAASSSDADEYVGDEMALRMAERIVSAPECWVRVSGADCLTG